MDYTATRPYTRRQVLSKNNSLNINTQYKLVLADSHYSNLLQHTHIYTYICEYFKGKNTSLQTQITTNHNTANNRYVQSENRHWYWANPISNIYERLLKSTRRAPNTIRTGYLGRTSDDAGHLTIAVVRREFSSRVRSTIARSQTIAKSVEYVQLEDEAGQ